MVPWGDDDIRLLLVETDGRVVQLLEQDVHVGVEDVHDQKDDVGGPCGCDDLPSPSLSAGGVLDQTGHVEDLYLGMVVLHDSGDDVEGGEMVCPYLGFGPGELVQKGGLTDRRESDQGDGSVSRLLDVESFGVPAFGGAPLLLFLVQASDLGLQLAYVALRGLVVLGLGDLLLQFLDLLLDRRHALPCEFSP